MLIPGDNQVILNHLLGNELKHKLLFCINKHILFKELGQQFKVKVPVKVFLLWQFLHIMTQEVENVTSEITKKILVSQL